MKLTSAVALILAFVISGCGGGGGGGGSSAAAVTGANDGILISSNQDIERTMGSILAINEVNDTVGAAPKRAITQNKSGTLYYGTNPFNYSIATSLQFYDQSNQPTDNPASPYDISKHVASGTFVLNTSTEVVSITISQTGTNYNVTQFQQGVSLRYSISAVTTLTLQITGEDDVSISCAGNYSYYVTASSSNTTGSETITFPDGWTMDFTYSGNESDFTGTVKKSGIPEGTITYDESANTITVYDYESKETKVYSI